MVHRIASVSLAMSAAALGAAADISTSDVAAKLAKAESALGPASCKVAIKPSVDTDHGIGFYRMWGRFDLQFDHGKPRWRQHFSTEEIAPLRGARSIVAEPRNDQILWYGVYDDLPIPGTGRLGLPGTNVSPLVGRAYMGRWLSKVLPDLKNDRASTDGTGLVHVTGDYKSGQLSLVLDPARGWLAVDGRFTYPGQPGFEDRWTVDRAEEGTGDWYVASASAHTVFPTSPQTTGFMIDTSYEASDLKTGRSAEMRRFPTPVEGTLVSADDSTTHRLHPDGTLVFLHRRERRERQSVPWNLAFVFSGAVLLLSTLSWLVFSRKRSPQRP